MRHYPRRPSQWPDKHKGLNNLVIVKQCASHRWIDEGSKNLKEDRHHDRDRFLDGGGTKLYYILIEH